MRSLINNAIAKPHRFLSALAILSLAFNLHLYFILSESDYKARKCDQYRSLLFRHNEYVREAVRLWSNYSKESVISIESSSYPSLVNLKNETCISLMPDGVGANPVQCFDNKTKKITYIDPGGE